MVTIRVVNRSGSGVKHARVTILWRDTFGTHSKGYTDSNGYVHFNVGTGSGTIYVDGRQKYKGHVSGSYKFQA